MNVKPQSVKITKMELNLSELIALRDAVKHTNECEEDNLKIAQLVMCRNMEDAMTLAIKELAGESD